MWQEGTGGKDFPGLRNSRSRYVERNDNNDDSFKFLWSGMLVIEVINHVIVAVLLEVCVFHLRLTLLYCGIILPSVRERYYSRKNSVAGCWFVLFCFPHIFGRCSSFGNCKIRPMVQTQMQAGNTKRLANSSPEKDNKKPKDALRKTCSRPAIEDILECIWCEGFQHRECTKISADVCNALSSIIDNIVFFVLPVYNYFQLH